MLYIPDRQTHTDRQTDRQALSTAVVGVKMLYIPDVGLTEHVPAEGTHDARKMYSSESLRDLKVFVCTVSL